MRPPDAHIMIYQHEGDSRCRPVQTDTVNDISAGLNLGQGEIGSCCPSRFVLPKVWHRSHWSRDGNETTQSIEGQSFTQTGLTFLLALGENE